MPSVNSVGNTSGKGSGRLRKIATAEDIVADIVGRANKLKTDRSRATAHQERTLSDRRSNLNEAIRAKKDNVNLDPSQRTGDVDFTSLSNSKNIKSHFNQKFITSSTDTDHTSDDFHYVHPGKGKGKGIGHGNQGGMKSLRNELHGLRHDVQELSSTTTTLIVQNRELTDQIAELEEQNLALQEQSVALLDAVAGNTEALIDLAKKIVASGLGSPFTGAPEFDPNASSTEQLRTAANATNKFTGSLDLKSVEQSSNTGSGDDDGSSSSLTETLQARLGALLTKLEDTV